MHNKLTYVNLNDHNLNKDLIRKIKYKIIFKNNYFIISLIFT